MNPISALTLLALIVVGSCTGSCPVSDDSPVLYSDSLRFGSQPNLNTDLNSVPPSYTYQLDKALQATPSIAISLNQIQSPESEALDLRVLPAQVNPHWIVFEAQSDEAPRWTSCKINFIVTVRSDIELGSVTVRSPTVNPYDNTFNVMYNLRNAMPASGVKVKSFLQGVNLLSQSRDRIGIKQESSLVSNNQVLLRFSTPTRTTLVRSLTVSVVVFSIDIASILYSEGTINQNYVVSTVDIQIPRHGINELRTYIVGLNSFYSSASQPISISTSIDGTFSMRIGPIDRCEVDFVSVNYLILSVVDCGSCPGNPVLADGTCMPRCPPTHTPNRGRCSPIQCQQGQTLTPQGFCITTCRANEQYSSGTCVCVDGLYLINGKCDRCPEGHYYDFKACQCIPTCDASSIYTNGRCQCKPGFYLINNRCQQCTYGTQYNSILQRCMPICDTNQVYSPAGCLCVNGLYRINGRCTRCPYQQVYNPATRACQCADGLEFVLGSCVPACGRNQVRINGDCLCTRGYLRINGSCSICPPNSVYNQHLQRCICNNNYKQVYGQCISSCSDQQYIKNGLCVPYCRYGQRYIGYQCVCDTDFEDVNGDCLFRCNDLEHRVNGRCQCIPGYYKVPGTLCQKVNCPPGTIFNYTRGDCISACEANEVSINGRCVCQYGFNRNNPYGKCVANCCANQVINKNGLCQCAPGYTRIINGVCVPQGNNNHETACRSGSIILYGSCTAITSCGVNQYWCGTSCICIAGMYKVDGVCVSVQGGTTCPSNSVFNGVNCRCADGYFPVSGGTCQKCAGGMYWDGSNCRSAQNQWDGGNWQSGGWGFQCQQGTVWDPIKGYCLRPISCQANQEWDGYSCRCKQGYFLIQGSCSQCPAGTVFDGYRCSSGQQGQVCRDPYAIWNGVSCVCMAGYWPLTDGKCVACPEGFVWDGTCCKSKGEQAVPLTTW